jgi:hypothetical protein
MSYLANLRKSFSDFFSNPALLTVAILWFLLTFLVSILFDMIRLSALYYVNPGLFNAFLTGAQDWFTHLNTATYVSLGVFYVIEGFVFAYILSFFMAGFYGMLKNLMQDGSTVFAEFFPEAKRHWYAMFRLQITRVAAGLLMILLFGYSLLQLAGTTPGFITATQQLAITISTILGILLFLLLTYFLLYSESMVVLESTGAWTAIRDSSRLAANRIARTITIFLTMLLLIALAALLVYVLSAATDALLQPQASKAMMIIATILNYLYLLVGFSGVILSHLFIIRNYYQMTVDTAGRKQRTTAAREIKPIRKKRT